MNAVIKVEKLGKRFGKSWAVRDLTFDVPSGSIFAFLGPNGAGKTTTIKTLMNIRTPSMGRAEVLNCDSRRLSESEFRRIGYVSENQRLPDWMTADYFLAYCRKLYPRWDTVFCAELVRKFEIPLAGKIKDLSRGMRMKAALVASMAYHPELLVLDEPFSGLDPLVREELISGMLEMTAAQSWTIFLSSHDLAEVERLADTVAILDKGGLKLVEGTDDLLARFREIIFNFDPSAGPAQPLPESWLGFDRAEGRARFIAARYDSGRTESEVRSLFPSAQIVECRTLTLKEIFMALVRHFKIEQLEQPLTRSLR